MRVISYIVSWYSTRTFCFTRTYLGQKRYNCSMMSEVTAAAKSPPKGKGKEKNKSDKDSGDKRTELAEWPSYIQERLLFWDKLKAEYDASIASKPVEDIKVTLPDGKVLDAQSWRTTPYHVATGISQGLADSCVISKVNGELWDLDRPLEMSCDLELIKFDDDDGKQVFWHSTAHILGEAMERVYGGHLCYGPPIDQGFYYDMYLLPQPAAAADQGTGEHQGERSGHGHIGVSSNDFPCLESLCKSIVKEKQAFERLEVSKENLLEMFKYNKFKVRILNEKVTTPTTTIYRCGPLIDLCRGPHVRHTGKIKALKVTKNSSTFWEGDAAAESLQRVYGISFPDSKQLKEWEKFQLEAQQRDHRKIGRDQELFFFHDLSPGSCFFMPRGAHIYNKLIEFIKSEYWSRGFHEVISPNMYNSKLWEQSGHWQHYAEHMFAFTDTGGDSSAGGVASATTTDQSGAAGAVPPPTDQSAAAVPPPADQSAASTTTYALKPMNCPGHCLMFDHRPRSWRELPLRMADFGVLHRNELSGCLSGLTRVRRFQQDDAHIFCRPDQIGAEMQGCLDFLRHVYTVFGFTFKLYLSTRPTHYLGDISQWDEAEKQLEESLNAFGEPWKLNPEDGAFYGPKIDIIIMDALRRPHQCATIQLDFQLPERFNLTYVTGEGDEKKRPVIIHRAILGSVERMIAVLTESCGGKWPFWLSPRQCIVCPVGVNYDSYATEVRDAIHAAGFTCDADTDQGTTLNKKVRNAQLAQYNFILVVGEKESNNKTVNVRTRDNKVHGEFSVDRCIERFRQLAQDRTLDSEHVQF